MKGLTKNTKTLIIFMILISMLSLNVFGAGMYFYDNEWHTYTGKALKVTVNQKPLSPPVPPLIFGERAVVPARAVFEELGATVVWVPDQAQVHVILGKKQIILTINSTAAYIDNQYAKMEIAPKIVNDYTMIPVRFVSESLGFVVDFDGEEGLITINDPPKTANISNITTSVVADNFYITFTSDRAVQYESFTLTDPYRLVIDVFGGQVPSDTAYAINQGKLSAVRVANHPDKVRIVVDFTQFCAALVKVTDNKTFHIQIAAEDLTQTPVPSIVPTASPTAGPGSATPKPTALPTYAPGSDPTKSSPLVIIDPGHGGKDPGALGRDGDKVVLEEADVNLDISLRVYKRLQDAGVNVMMTRSDDSTVELIDRSKIANAAGGYLFISIHNNSAVSPDISGTMVLSYLDTNPNSSYAISSKELGQIVLSELLQTIDTSDKGQRDGSMMSVIKHTNMPAIIVEVAFLSNQSDLEKLMDDEFKEKAAEGIANGIIKALALVNERLSGQTTATHEPAS